MMITNYPGTDNNIFTGLACYRFTKPTTLKVLYMNRFNSTKMLMRILEYIQFIGSQNNMNKYYFFVMDYEMVGEKSFIARIQLKDLYNVL